MRRESEADQRRHEENPAADAEHAGENACREAEQDGQDDRGGAHPMINQTPIPVSKAANPSVSDRPENRCWNVAPLSTPAVAGRPTSAA